MKKTTGIRRLILLLLLLLLAAGWVVHHHPLRLAAQEERIHGSPFHCRDAADLLLLIDAEGIAEVGRRGAYQEVDWSYGWSNLAEQLLGRYAVAGPAEITGGVLEGRRVVVVTRSGVRAAELWLPQLKLFLQEGGILVLEWPTNRWQELTGVEVIQPPQPMREITGLRMAEVRDLPAMPWVTFRQLLKVVDPEVEVLAEVEGRPVILRRTVGRGTLIVFGLDVGRQITALQQGTAQAESMQVQDRYPGLLRPGLHTDDLVADARLLTAAVPYADVFESFILAIINQVQPLAGWWLFPHALPGAYLATQDELGMGDPAAWMSEAEEQQGHVSTCFLAQGQRLTPRGLERFPQASRGALGLIWNFSLDEQGLFEPIGVLGFEPLLRQHTLREQTHWFTQLTTRPVLYSRTLGAAWNQEWAERFQALAAVGVRLDSSYGPAGGRGLGYLFGTGLPFQLLDPQGLPLGELRELPFVVGPEGQRLGRETLLRLLRESAEIYHQAVTSRLSPAAFQDRPDVELFLTWKEGFAEARRLGLWITDLPHLDEFFQVRRESGLSSVFHGGMLLVTAQVVLEGQTLALPAQWAGRPAGPVLLDGQETAPRRISALGGDLLLVPLRAGNHALAVDYLEVR